MLPTLLHDPGNQLTISQQGIKPGHHILGVVYYKALIGLSLLQVPHFCARHGASLKDLNPDTTSASKAKCFLVSQ
jgi:hypothetical protein